jgi:hypothetical protein
LADCDRCGLTEPTVQGFFGLAPVLVTGPLADILDQIPNEFALKRRRVQTLIRQIDAVT